MSHDRYGMIKDIISDIPHLTVEIMDAVRLAYFRGLSHSDDKVEILSREIKACYEGNKFIPLDPDETPRTAISIDGKETFTLNSDGCWVSDTTGKIL